MEIIGEDLSRTCDCTGGFILYFDRENLLSVILKNKFEKTDSCGKEAY